MTGLPRPGAHGVLVDIAVVEIDPDTGVVQVLDYVTVHDAGRLLNPMLADGQIAGGFAHGAGVALLERHAHDEWGNLMTSSFVDYLAPAAPDVPAVRIGHRSSPSPFTALGAKGLGEGNTMSAPVAIANAVADALGRDDLELPLTPPRVWELLQPADVNRRGRSKPTSGAESLEQAWPPSRRAARMPSRSPGGRASSPR